MQSERSRRRGVGFYFLMAFIVMMLFGWWNLFPLLLFAGFIWWAAVKVIGVGSNQAGDLWYPPGRWARDLASNITTADHRPQQSDPQRVASERALRRAGQAVINSQAQLSDIGLLVYEDAGEPQIVRMGDVPTNAAHIRPFVVFELSAAAAASAVGTIRFNLIDGQGNLRYTVRSRYTLRHGVNFITPPTWLPLKEQNPGGMWSLQINVGDGEPIAIHEFRWFTVGGELRAALTGDGEIDEVMKDVIEQHTAADDTMSLDELLGEQDEVAPAVMQARH